ncbi:ATP-binding protein [Bernardetia sp. ABR2-2B]|uniref:sensor histidine kinase n=1 Tax=Bernardetia sp. ABR2-2B TaxID=3127472 RepID=UPI0030CF2894
MNSTKELYRNRAIQLFIFSFILTTIAFAFIGMMFWNHYESSKKITEQIVEVENIEGEILLYDEMLTMSARMYTSTANTMWEERYNQTVPLLDSALLHAEKVAPKAFEKAIQKTDKANQALIQKETKAFELTKEGNKELAYSIISDVSYQEYKKTYASGMQELTQAMKEEVVKLQQKNENRATLASTITLIIVPFLLFVWYNTLRLIRKYITTQSQLQLEITKQNEGLEQKVIARTSEIQEKNEELQASEEELRQNLEELQTTQEQLQNQKEEIENAYKQLQSTQQQLIQSEKMASLGQLVANIAHEINTPLGAIRSSADSIETILLKTLSDFSDFIKKLDTQTLSYFDEFVALSTQKIDIFSSKQKRRAKYALIDKLEELEIENDEFYADVIMEMNMQDEKELFMKLLQSNNSEELKTEVFDTALRLSNIIKSNQTIKEATNRAAKTVFALKNFARQDHSEEKTEVNLNQTLETTLTLYYNQTKVGIDVIRNLEEMPSFLGYPDELMQVWTNLIHNAIQAMKGKGELSIATQNKQDKVVVSIQDTGGGIPIEIQDKIFDAFFTTKVVGEGSGLGLDITRKIIEKHNGKIWFETQEGVGTTFFVEIPIQIESKIKK